MEKHWKFLLHTKIAYDLRVCHDLDPRSFGQGQSHWQKFVSGQYVSYGETLKVPTSHKEHYDLRVCHDFDTRSFGQV